MGVLGTRRKPFQDSPTPAGNSVAAIALLRLYAYTNQQGYRDKAEQTMELLAGLADKFGIFAATYGVAAVHFSQPHTQTVVIGEDDMATQLYGVAVKFFRDRQVGSQTARERGSSTESSTRPGGNDSSSDRHCEGKVNRGRLLRIHLPASHF